ncbi:cytochrome c oxidase subunit II [Streptomyces hoynatensis]|uniref:cytochrome-c oxidase n=1 Tax=Streptomyces hoynatensis TaxID=1141874 RepID=A0A3A9YUW0_9ACTN|nr:cytochrome c oxidase subunit II [Streptomyces hoynatensis]RKN39006.1 cytochrome c oxidase subunit II [Streptomyces hoynatensis]
MRQADVFGEVFAVELIMAGAVFLAVLAAVLYAVLRRRAGAAAGPSERAERPRLEAAYVAVLAAVAVFLVVYTALANHREHRTGHVGAPAGPPAAPEVVEVDVTAFQWCWTFRHPRPGGAGATSGTCRAEEVPTLVVPTGRPVRVELTSRDVIHSLWVPELRYKMDAFPHHTNSFTLTLDEEGRWLGRCAEFCGYRHYAMHFWLRAVSPGEYERWVAGHQAAAGGAA